MSFVAVILSVVYLVAVGIAKIVYLLASPGKKKTDSYWILDTTSGNDKKFTSAY